MDSMLRFLRKLWFLLRRPRFATDLAEEMAYHRELSARDRAEEGLTPEQARTEAARQFGNATRAGEESLETVAFRTETLWQDLRYAARQLRHNPGFALTAIIILALGIGATTAIFSAVNPILFEPLPYPEPQRIMSLAEMRTDSATVPVAFGTFYGLRERSRSFDAISVFKAWQPAISSDAQPERLEGQSVTPDYFRVLGIAPEMGRDFQPADDLPRGPKVVIISHSLWQRRFGGDRLVVGRPIKLNDQLYTVIGVMPESLENVLAPEAELWSPLQYDTALVPQSREWGHHLRMTARLSKGVSRSQAQAELAALMPQLGQTYAAGFASTGGVPRGISVTPLRDDLTRAVRPALLAIVGAVLLVLMIACVNVTNLQLARGAQRRGEFAIRSALGAARTRMVRQLLTESLLLAAAGGALAILVAQFGVRAIIALSPPELPRLGAIRLDAPVFLFGIAITTLVGILAGLVPALHVSRTDPQSGLQLSTRTTAGSRQLTRRVLVIAEVALALVLLTSAGLLVRSVQRIFAIDPGFNPHHLLTMQVQTSGHHFADDAATERFFSQALEAVKSVPGVAQAAFTSQLPLSGDYENYGLQFEKDAGRIRNQVAFRYAVSPDYFAAMQIPLRRGRLLTEHDVPGAPMAIVISESLARSVFGDHLEDAIGQRLRIGPSLNDPTKAWSVIVGVVGEVKQSSLAVTEPDAFYVSAPQWFWSDNKRSLVVRTGALLGTNPAGLSESVRNDNRPAVQPNSSDTTAVFEKTNPATLASSVRNAIWSVDKDQPVLRVATMDKLMEASEAQRHFALILFEAFALVALLLAAGGIYGVLSGSVSERMRELGVRSALGATRFQILALVLRQGLMLTLVGAVIGLVGALAASQALTTLLYGISRLDPVTYLGVIAVLCVVSVLACWLPARRAARVEPSVVLRAE